MDSIHSYGACLSPYNASCDWRILVVDKEKEQHDYVTKAKLNEVVFEIKTEMREMDVKHEKFYAELVNNNASLSQTMSNLDKSIITQTEMMGEMLQDSKIMRQEIIDMQKENISRDNEINNLNDFKNETSEQMSRKSKEVFTFLGVIAMGVFGIIQAVIQVSHYFF